MYSKRSGPSAHAHFTLDSLCYLCVLCLCIQKKWRGVPNARTITLAEAPRPDTVLSVRKFRHSSLFHFLRVLVFANFVYISLPTCFGFSPSPPDPCSACSGLTRYLGCPCFSGLACSKGTSKQSSKRKHEHTRGRKSFASRAARVTYLPTY